MLVDFNDNELSLLSDMLKFYIEETLLNVLEYHIDRELEDN